MEELHKTQEHPLERDREGAERRQAQQQYEGDDRRKPETDVEKPPVSEEDGTRRG